MIAQINYNSRVVEKLMNDYRTNLNIKDKKGQSFLSLTYSNSDIFKTLVRRSDIDLNTVDKNGLTPLHMAALNKDFDLVEYILYSRRNSISVNARTNSGCSLMHIAARIKSIKLMIMFNNAGLSYNVQDNDGKTPLMVLIGEKSPIIKQWEHILSRRELNINLKDHNGITLLIF